MGILKIIGGLLVAWGLIDLGMGWAGTDVWQEWFGIRLPDIVWRFSAWAAILIGGVLWSLDGADADENEDENAQQ